MKKLFVVCVASPLILALSACSSGGSSSGGQTVFAQTAYSNSSLSGTYSVSWLNIESPNSGFYSGIGTLQFNGSGNITGGTLNFYGTVPGSESSGSASSCVYAASGTYSIQNTALGTATLNLSSSTTGCAASETWHISLAAADGGAAIQLARTDASTAASGNAVKQ